MVKTILVPTDGSAHALKAVDVAADLAATYGAKVIILHVLQKGPLPVELMHAAEVEHVARPNPIRPRNLTIMPQEIMARVDKAEQPLLEVLEFIGNNIMEGAERAAHDKGITDLETAIEQGDPTGTILDKAKQVNADMIIMGSRGLGGIEGLVLGSVSHKVSHHAPCTCILVK